MVWWLRFGAFTAVAWVQSYKQHGQKTKQNKKHLNKKKIKLELTKMYTHTHTQTHAYHFLEYIEIQWKSIRRIINTGFIIFSSG